MIPLFKVTMNPEAPAAVAETLMSGFVAQGPKVDELEQKVDKLLHHPTAPVAVNSCTSAIDLALEIIGINRFSTVVSTPMTCFATNVHLKHRGANIVWADVYPETGLINPESVESEEYDAALAVNWAGKFADYQGMVQRFGNTPIIEDAAHTWDIYSQRPRFRGDWIAYSLQAIKFLTGGDGGLLLAPTRQLEQGARTLRWYGLDRSKKQNFRETQDIEFAGFKYNMNDVSATIALANLDNANRAVENSRNNAYFFSKYIDNDNIIVQPYDNTASYWIFPLIVRENRDGFVKYLEDNHIQAAPVHFRNDHYSIFSEFRRELPGLDYFSAHHTNIPCGWWLGDGDHHYIVEKINSWRP